MDYRLALCDAAPVAASYVIEPRYLGYRDEDRRKPYARFFQERARPVQAHVKDALLAGPVAAEFGTRKSTVAAELSRPGYLPLETGYTINEDGHIVVAVLTDMPGVTGEMWDWWAWWTRGQPARYKLWHPEAHLFAGYAEDRSRSRGLSDRDRYVEKHLLHRRVHRSYQVAPAGKLPRSGEPGFRAVQGRRDCHYGTWRSLDRTAGCGVADPSGSSITKRSALEMRSRFIINDLKVLRLPAHSVTTGIGRLLSMPGLNDLAGMVMNGRKPARLHEVGPAMLYHCAQEMNHLASFLPRLHEEFSVDSRL